MVRFGVHFRDENLFCNFFLIGRTYDTVVDDQAKASGSNVETHRCLSISLSINLSISPVSSAVVGLVCTFYVYSVQSAGLQTYSIECVSSIASCGDNYRREG